MLRNVVFHDHRFSVEGIDITDRTAFDKAMELVSQIYNGKFLADYSAFDKKRKLRQKERAKKKKKSDRLRQMALQGESVSGKFNIYKWTPAVSRAKIKRLYEDDTKGLLDSDLLADVGYTFYARCLQGKEEWEIMEEGKVRCHNCGNVLPVERLLACECGYQYTYKEYRKSFRANNMPTGAAKQIFCDFIKNWPKAKNNDSKMRVIDNLIHECHFNIRSGAKGRPVGFNLIQGTNGQVIDLILNLAHGDLSRAEVVNRDTWRSSCSARVISEL